MSKVVTFTIDGRPYACQRPRYIAKLKRVLTSKSTRQTQANIAKCAKDAMAGRSPLTGALRVEISFYFPRPKKWHGGYSHTSRPDIDNLAKNVLDACNTIVWADDCQIAQLVCDKRYDEIQHTRVWVIEEAGLAA